jgi:hypothetical protein
LTKEKKKPPKPKPPEHEKVEQDRPAHVPFHVKQAAQQPSRSYLKKDKEQT